MPKRIPIVIFGTGGHSIVVSEIVRLTSDYEIAGYIEEYPPTIRNTYFESAPIMTGFDGLAALSKNEVNNAIVAIGDCQNRLRVARQFAELGFDLVRIIHPSAVIGKTVSVGGGTMVGAQTVINPLSKVGENVIINTAATIDHECRVDSGVHVAPGAHIAGGVSIGKGTMIGIGSSVKEGTSIGEGSVIGAGSVVINDIPSGVLAYGVPARVIKSL